MCTAIHYCPNSAFFGRTLDLHYHYKECFCIIPRNFDYGFVKNTKNSFAVMGTAFIKDSFPLLYDAANEKGLAMAGLNFVGNAVYDTDKERLFQIPVFKFIPWVLSQAANVAEAEELINKTNITSEIFSDELPNAQLHFIIADKEHAITVEPIAKGIVITENPVGVLTNNPTFDFHINNLCRYANLSNTQGENAFEKAYGLKVYSNGQAALGLPGDYSSPSRFVRTAFLKANSTQAQKDKGINQLFHILNSVQVPRGAVKRDDNKYVTTVYTCGYDLDKKLYYYKTYENQNIKEYPMDCADLNGKVPFCFPFA
ncbi:MAG: choloylglycine hydrolase family protein [Ruminococcaceae bacterium]|nr:choloylglycine hydrolase family protein [Oscillospiraceae bacterium]